MNKAIKIELPKLDLTSDEKIKWKLFYKEKLNSSSEKWLLDIWDFLLRWMNEEETIDLKTSGSTGEPRTIKVKKSTMIFSARQSSEYFQFKENEKWLLCLPAAFIGGQMIMVRAILNETQVFAIEPKIDFSKLENNFDFASMIPMQVEKYLQNDSKIKIKRILIGGAEIPFSLEKRLKFEIGIDFYASYGMTETVSHIALRKINGEGNSEYFTGFKNILLGTDDRGCLTIYNKNYSENVLITNDLVEFDSHGRFKIIGRIDNVINSGGLKIIPEELEKIISEIVSQRILIVGIRDEITGEKPILLIEGIKWDSVTLNLLKKHFNDFKDKKKVPKEIHFIDKFLETENRKIDRRKTKDYFLKNLPMKE